MEGSIVKDYLRKKNINMSHISRKLGISPQHLNNILNSPDITTDNLKKISIATELNLFSLIQLENESEATILQSVVGDNNNMVGRGSFLSNKNETIELKKQLINKDKTIRNLLKHQEILINQITLLTSKL